MENQRKKRMLKIPFFEFAMLIPIVYSFKVAVNDNDFAQMTVTVALIAFAWVFTIIKYFFIKE